MADRSHSSTIVIFDATGDLTRRKLVPALYNLCRKNELPERMRIVGFSIEPYREEEFHARLRAGVQEFSPVTFDTSQWYELWGLYRLI